MSNLKVNLGIGVSSDVKSDYIDKLKRGKTNEEVTREILEMYKEELTDSDDGPDVWFGLANVQWDYGRLLPEVKEKALEALEEIEHLDRYKESSKSVYEKRVKTLELLKEKLSMEMSPEKKVSKYKPYVIDWKDGDIFAYKLDNKYSKETGYYGKYALLRKVGDGSYWPVHTVPVMQIYKWISDEVPNIDIVNELSLNPAYRTPSIYKDLKNDKLPYKFQLDITSKSQISKDKFVYLGNCGTTENPKHQQNQTEGFHGYLIKSLDDIIICSLEWWKDII
ncbi:hypothetical protein [Clostridium sp. LP20]|uniref:hypothetical protein n=1 Tax=Clostridium sp. LP20 TaxID=3418665 RepID=UPI003EE4D2D4